MRRISFVYVDSIFCFVAEYYDKTHSYLPLNV